jgi:Trk K+ transport system NAD-binding subunit
MIVDSLLLIHTIQHLDEINPRIIQIIYNDFELRVFKNTGIYRIIMPDAFVARNMLIPLIRHKKMTTSFIFSFAHIYEHRIQKDDFFHNKNKIKLEKNGILILLIKRKGFSHFTKKFVNNKKFQVGDYIIAYHRPK